MEVVAAVEALEAVEAEVVVVVMGPVAMELKLFELDFAAESAVMLMVLVGEVRGETR